MTLLAESQLISPPTAPSKTLHDVGSQGDCTSISPLKILQPQHTFMTQRSSLTTPCSSPIMQQHQQHNLRDNLTEAVTDSTKFSVASGATGGAPCPCDQGSNDNTSFRRRAHCSQNKKTGSTRKLKITGLFNRCKQLSSPFRRRKALSETQLRKRLRKYAERGDWDAVRKLIDGYEFSDRPEQNVSKQQQQQQAAALRDSFVIENPLQQGDEPIIASRRPSYGSRNGERLSFTGKESAAAAAVIKAALLEESSASASLDYDTPEMGENVLHDVCKSRPPLDVLETLISALRHRRGCTAATDDMGRTPLHLAADTGASPEIIRALVRSDPYIASMGDNDRRSPLHLAVKYLADHRIHHSTIKNTSQEKLTISPEDVLELTHQVVDILKDAMLTYPGKIDFKDEDASGYSPLDYAIDVNVTKKELIQSLIRRKEPTKSRRSSRQLRGRPIRRLTTQTSISDDQDIEILESLEQDEIEARRHRIQQMKQRQKKEIINDALFDVFGIDESARASAEAALLEQVEETANKSSVASKSHASSREDNEPLAGAEPKTTEEQEDQPGGITKVMSDAEIYNQHLQDYLDDFMDDFDGVGDLEYCDDDEFDIHDDPSLARMNEEENAVAHQPAPMIDDNALKRIAEGNAAPLVITLTANNDDDCVSLVSEITVRTLVSR